MPVKKRVMPAKKRVRAVKDFNGPDPFFSTRVRNFNQRSPKRGTAAKTFNGSVKKRGMAAKTFNWLSPNWGKPVKKKFRAVEIFNRFPEISGNPLKIW